MEYISGENISKSFGEKVLFDHISFQVNKGDKIALIAKNGSGKSTLLKVIADLESIEGENASLRIKKDLSIGYLEQIPILNPDLTALEEIFTTDHLQLNAVRNHQIQLKLNDKEGLAKALLMMDELQAWDMEAKVGEILDKLNLQDLHKKVSQLSGGQQKRLAMAKLLISDPDMFILDEPTNHLDIQMIEWLEDYLQAASVTVLMVTHDRYFLERVCNQILELDNGNVFKYNGNYSDFLQKKAERFENESVRHDKNRKLLKKELDWIRRQPKARGTKAKSRVQQFENLKTGTEAYSTDDEMNIMLKSSRLGSKILEAHNISKQYDANKIIEGFSYKFKKGEKVGIVGPNGVGKSTFIDILTQTIRPDSGKIVIGETIQFGYYRQEGIILSEDKKVIDYITDIAEFIPMEKGYKLTAPQLLERFLFPRPQQQVYISQLSGGEKRRLYLLSVLMQNPNFLILDEPTNDLDVLTLNILEDYLANFPGCVLVVTHDRFLLDKLVDHLFIFKGNGEIKDYNGSYSKYRALYGSQTSEGTPAVATNSKKKEDNIQQFELRKDLKRIEKKIEKLHQRKDEINEAFLDSSLELETLTKLSEEMTELNNQIETSESTWMELVEKVEE